MKRRVRSIITLSALGLIIALALTSCSDGDNYYEEGAVIDTRYFDVLDTDNSSVSNRWMWNPAYSRNECVFQYPALTNYIYENGVIHAAVLVNETYNGQSYQTLKSLPYIRTYEVAPGVFYTETINYDVSPGNPGTINFYIQGSDLGPSYLQDYRFKVSLLWY